MIEKNEILTIAKNLSLRPDTVEKDYVLGWMLHGIGEHQSTKTWAFITPRELEVGNLVKDGKTSKEIAEILNSTERAVVAHRTNLRKKLGLEKKSNLRTYLISLK